MAKSLLARLEGGTEAIVSHGQLDLCQPKVRGGYRLLSGGPSDSSAQGG